MNTEREDIILRLFANVKNLITGAFLAVCFAAAPAFPASAAPLTGALDVVSDTAVSGWAISDTEEPAEITVTVTDAAGQVVQNLSDSADMCRQDLIAAGKGDGEYGFSIETDWDSLADGLYMVRAYADGTELPGSRHYVKGQAGGAGLQSLGTFKLTGYCPCYSCSEGWGRHTSTGAMASANHTIAVDPRVIPYGTKVMINGTVYTAEDKGGGVRGNHIDVFYNTHQETKAQGTQYQEVFLVV